MPDRTAGRDRLGGGNDRIRVDAVVPVKRSQRTGLAEMLDAEGTNAVTGDRTEPCQGSWMTVEHGDDPAMRGNVRQQTLDMRTRMDQASFACALSRSPSGIEAIRRCHGEKAHVAAVFRHQADGFNRFGRDGPGVGNNDLAVGPRLAMPVGAVDNLMLELECKLAADLFDRPGRKPQIDRSAC